jgi:hypothetical protein
MSEGETSRPEAPGTDGAPTMTWSIDREGRIEAVGAGWNRFAEDNGGQGLLPPGILGRGLSDFFGGLEVRALLGELFRRVRHKGEPVTIPFRCDSPSELRQLTLTIQPRPDGGIDFVSRTQALVERSVPALVLDGSAPRSLLLLSLCAWCKRVEVPDWKDLDAALEPGSWLELDEAMGRLPILEPPVPRITHGICPTCRATLMDESDDQVA